MADRKLVVLITIFLSIGALIYPLRLFAYGVETHAYLTDEIISFYNAQFPHNPISGDIGSFLIDGSRHEDSIPRWMNHFYDPVYDRGIESIYGNGYKSKEWVVDTEKQNEVKYKITTAIASILTAVQQRKIGAITVETDFTWNRAIRFYLQGEKERAMYLLGHILHLIQDTSVPDHTRNDAHTPIKGEKSFYEDFAKKFNLVAKDRNLFQRLENKNPILFENLESHFDSLANYSNRDFYSRDTIGIQSGYSEPQPDFEIREDKFFYGVKKDPEFGEYMLYRKSTPNPLFANTFNITVNDEEFILPDYWRLLSTKAVQHSAGVIDLFFREVERAQDDPIFLAEVMKEEQSFFGQVVDAVKGVVSDSVSLVRNTFSPESGFQLVQEIPVGQYQERSQEQITSVQEPESSLVFCSFNTANTPSRDALILSEIAWMGISQSPNAEWIELKNISSAPLNIGGYQIIDEKEQIQVGIPENTTLQPGGFYLLERSSDSTVPAVPADIVYQGALSNTNEGLRLFDSNCNLLDEILARPEWPAGDNGSKQTMERGVNLGWHTSAAPGGTPRLENSAGAITFEPVVSLDKQTIRRGEMVREGGSGFSPGGEVIMHFVLPDGRDVTARIIANANGSFEKAYTMPLDALLGDYTYYAEDVITGSVSEELVYKVVTQEAEDKENVEEEKKKIEDVEEDERKAAQCSFNVNQSPSHKNLIINEVAWMGTPMSAQDEWIEIKNISNSTLNLGGYQLLDKDTQISIALSNDVTIGVGGFLLLERTDDNTLPNIAANVIYTGGLSNSDEGLRLFDSNCNLLDEVKANPDWPAGDNSSKSTMERSSSLGWHTSTVSGGTPKRENTTPVVSSGGGGSSGGGSPTPPPASEPEPEPEPESEPEPEPEPILSTSTSTAVVISEIMPGAGTNFSEEEFIELYNPTDQIVDVTRWSVRRRSSATSTSTQTLVGSFATSSIPSHGFFLIGSPEYAASSTAKSVDEVYSSSYHLAYSDDIVLLVNADNEIVDEVIYASVARGASWERYAYQNQVCYTAQGAYEFKGNGCPESTSFSERNVPYPQNTQSMLEPRTAPTSATEPTVAYNPDTLTMTFSWDPYTDTEGNRSDVTYEITEYASPGIVVFNSTAIGWSKRIDVIGKTYTYAFRALDRDRLGSAVTTSTVDVPSFLNSLSFYRDPRSSTSTEYFIDMSYSSYPFIPDLYKGGVQSSWKAVVLYLNTDAMKQEFLENASNWIPDDTSNILKVKFTQCSGSKTSRHSLLLPDTLDRCSPFGGGLNPVSLGYDTYRLEEDTHLLVSIASSTSEITFLTNDYITAAFYSFYKSGGNQQTFKMAAIDATQYLFSTSPPVTNPPVMNDVTVVFDKSRSALTVSWPQATDSNTIDSVLTYEINFSPTGGIDESSWQEIGSVVNFDKVVAPGNNFLIGVRARDILGNVSNVATATWQYPPATFFLVQDVENNWSDAWGRVTHSTAEPDTASYQSFMPNEDFSFNKVVVKLSQTDGADTTTVRLSVYAADGSGNPDFTQLLGEAKIGSLFRPDPAQEITFSFVNPISAAQGQKYWLILDVAQYGDNRGFYRNDWRNAIITGGSAYDGGEAGKGYGQGRLDTCIGYCSFTGNYSSGSADWYFKLGLE